jgi:hypothetical protein
MWQVMHMHRPLASTTSLCALALGLLLNACGGRAFENGSDMSEVEGSGGSGAGAGSSGAGSSGAGSSGAGGDAQDPDDGSGAGGGGDDPEPGDPVEPTPTTEPEPGDPVEPTPTTEPEPANPGGGGCPADCPVVALCKLCEDGSCGVPEVSCNADGSCGETSFVCAPTPPDPEPSEYEPCLDKVCGEQCDACAPGLQCLIGVGYCDLDGNCSPAEPVCQGTEPGEPEPSCDCPVPELCQLCESDGSCAAGVAQCDERGECVGIDWVCPGGGEARCEAADDCPTDDGCQVCANGAEWCPGAVCRAGECESTPNLCPESYVPCSGKEEGEACQMCSPLDADCLETDELKACHDGRCEGGASAAR